MLFGFPIAAITVDEFIGLLVEWSGDRSNRRAIAYLNAHTSNLLHENDSYHALMQCMNLLYADGMAVVRATRRVSPPGVPERVNAGDFFVRFAWAAQSRGRRIALVGSRSEAVESCAASIRSQVPGLEWVLVHHGHFQAGGAEEDRLIEQLRAAAPDILVIGMGSPRQEAWAIKLRDARIAPVVWCVGALFEYYGYRRRAPVWMREAGLEWLFRFAMEPRRMAKRYLIGNPKFLMRVRKSKREGGGRREEGGRG